MMPLGVVAMFGDVVLKGTALLVVAFVLARALRNAPAAARHLVWSVALVGLLLIPALSGRMPWKLEVLPAISKEKARRTAVENLVQTFFDGSVERAALALANMADAALPASRIDALAERIRLEKEEGK